MSLIINTVRAGRRFTRRRGGWRAAAAVDAAR
jgi:hypothetical protein